MHKQIMPFSGSLFDEEKHSASNLNLCLWDSCKIKKLQSILIGFGGILETLKRQEV